ncbi:MAG: 3-isopropylmalate dehydratase large subunit [candidate division WS1 bacterium]|nr:3-isopropylmalate dehydratase large subunit [candidate division WS1 bacterium]
MTITEKILANAAGVDRVRPGDFVTCKLSLVLANDITAPISIREFREMGATKVFDPERVVLVADHNTPNKDIQSAENTKLLRDFAREQGLKHFYEAQGGGIEHIIVPDKGLALPGDVVIGADSHTCTYGAVGAFATGVGSTDAAGGMALGETWFRVPESMKFIFTGSLQPWVGGKDLILYAIGKIGVDGARYRAMEFAGPVIESLDMAGRFTMCNMAIEAGGKSGIVAPDQTTLEWVKPRAAREFLAFHSDPNAEYAEVCEWDAGDIEPQVAFPHLPENARGLSEVGEIRIDQAVIGACTNGRLEDLRVAAQVLKGRKVAPGVRCLVFPGSTEIHLQATQEGLVETFLEAGCLFGVPTCGPCLGGHSGCLAQAERAIATTNRNFVGRMGHPKSEIYLAGPAITAASAVLGKIGGPDELS